MRRLFLVAAMVAIGFSAAAQGTPPLRGAFSASELSPFVEAEWNASGDAAGSARRMFDAFDGRANLREGLVKKELKGQTVYWEHYALHSSIIVHRADSTEAQDIFTEGAARHTGYSYKTRDTNDGISYFERTDFMDEGFVSIWALAQSFDSSHKNEINKDKSMSGEGNIEVWYTPLKVHIKSAENVFPVYEGCTGAMDFYLSDLQDRWAIDGYTFKVTSMNTDIFTVEQPEVTTDAEGKAHIRLHGVEKGKGRLRVYLYLAQPENNCYVQVEEYFDVEVLEAEKWSYSMSVHDQFTLPAHDYSMHGEFSVAGSLDEEDQPHWVVLEPTPVSRSGGGTFTTQGEFLTPTVREDGIVLGFDIMGILNRTDGAVAANLGTALEGIAYAFSGGQTGAQTTDSKNVVTGALMILEEGSWPYLFNVQMMEQLAGSSVSGNDIYALEAAGKELEAKHQAQEQSNKKPKKKGLIKGIRDGMKALDEVGDKLSGIDFSGKSTLGATAYTPEQEAAKAEQIAYIKEHHCLVIPDLTQLILPHFGNWIEEGKKAGPGGDTSWMKISGTLTLRKEK
ncbi:MAG: hypothetical protein J5748_05320 [Bacteroidales bacterium]|nr:hypothetical protein [Bacteroidales bacterium]